MTLGSTRPALGNSIDRLKPQACPMSALLRSLQSRSSSSKHLCRRTEPSRSLIRWAASQLPSERQQRSDRHLQILLGAWPCQIYSPEACPETGCKLIVRTTAVHLQFAECLPLKGPGEVQSNCRRRGHPAARERPQFPPRGPLHPTAPGAAEA